MTDQRVPASSAAEGSGAPQGAIVMLNTRAKGGMRSVEEGYERDSVFEPWPVVHLHTHDDGAATMRAGLFFKALGNLLGMLITGKVRVVHSHVSYGGSFWRKSVFATIARLFGVPTVLHLHGSNTKTFFAAQPDWRMALIRYQLRRADAVIVLSESWRNYITDIEPRTKLHVVPNGVALAPARERPARADGRVSMLFLGLVGERKGVYDLLEALAKARVQAPELHLVVGGDGEVDKARARADELGLGDAVDFRGWIAGPAKDDLLRDADLYVLPSHFEGLPVSILEAMSHSLPVVSTRVGGIPEQVREGQEGLLVDAGDVDALAAALVALAADPALRNAMGQRGRARIESVYAIDRIAAQLRALYRDWMK